MINNEELAELVGENDNAIFDNSGSAKTYRGSRVIQNLFTIPDKILFNGNIFIFKILNDKYAKYKDLNKRKLFII